MMILFHIVGDESVICLHEKLSVDFVIIHIITINLINELEITDVEVRKKIRYQHLDFVQIRIFQKKNFSLLCGLKLMSF